MGDGRWVVGVNTSLVEHVEHFQRRMIADALAEATSD